MDANGFSTRVAVVEDGAPVELYVEQEGAQRLVGNIYNGKVQNVLPGMQAAFIDIGLERNAFLYAGDIVMPDGADEDIEREKIRSMRNIRDMLKPGQTIMVQVAKDPVGTKGARVTTHITLAGRSLVLMPTMDYVGVSRRIDKDEERTRLRRILSEIRPENMGVIVRTASAGKSREAFAEDLESLKLLYEDIQKRAKKQKAPSLLHAEQSLLFRTVRDLLMKDVDRVFVNDAATFERLREIADMMAPKLKPRILLKQSEALFDRYETESKIDKALARKVWIKNGSYIIIDRTEALTCIDVNTGKFVGKDNLEKTITATNCEAAREIARQLRLRDIGGIIIIDFIDMERETRTCSRPRASWPRCASRRCRCSRAARTSACSSRCTRTCCAPWSARSKSTAPCSRRRRAAHTMCAQTTRCTSKSSPCARWPSGAWRRRKRTAKSCIDTAAGLW